MGATIETEVTGSVSAVDGAADWLRSTLKKRVEEAADHALDARRRGSDEWEGESGDAYVRVARDVVQASDNQADRIKNAADKIDAYANRLQLCKDRMASVRERARSGSLTVSGTTVHPPDESTAEDSDYATRVELFNSLVSEVNTEVESFEDWIKTNLTPVAKQLEDPAVEKILGTLTTVAGKLGLAIGLEVGKSKLEAKAKELDAIAKELDRWKRSGNPARRAANEAAKAAGALDDLRKYADWIGKGGKALGPVGIAIDVAGALGSDKPAGGLIAAGLGAGATAVVIATAPVSVPTIAVVAGAAAIGVGVSIGAEKVWDVLPDDFTDPIDDAVSDAVDNTADAISDGWDKVTGWF